MEREKRFHITDERVESYIRETIQPYDGILAEIRETAVRENVPVIEIESTRMLEIITRIKRPKRVLEIGTAIGFTSILISEGMAENGVIDTIEIDAETAYKADKNFLKAGIRDRVNLIVGDAADVLGNLDKLYDLIFIDAAKGQYGKYYELCSGMVNHGGVIFSDNVLYRGMTAGGAKINRRQQLLVRRLRKYLSTVCADERFITDILSVGDGICLSYRK